ncbi:MAG: FAD binding domain-containing protein [Acidimicrobiia bacterium]|nr:FAD binding domain-containing protein [Acidimicrobiia bacterium]
MAHGDPEGDWNSVLLATGAEVVAEGSNGTRSIPIGDLVVGVFTNSLEPDEMVTEVRIPVPTGRSSGTYLKLERRIGDYATVGVAVHLALAADGTISDAGIGLTSVAPINTKATAAEDVLRGNEPSPELFAEAAELAAAASEPRDDVRGSAEWKRHVVKVFTRLRDRRRRARRSRRPPGGRSPDPRPGPARRARRSGALLPLTRLARPVAPLHADRVHSLPSIAHSRLRMAQRSGNIGGVRVERR